MSTLGASDFASEGEWAALPLGRGVALLAHDANGVAALYKPAGLLSHPNTLGEEARSLLRARYDLRAECYEWDSALGKLAEAGGELALDETAGLEGGEALSRIRKAGAPGSSGAPQKETRRLYLLNRLDSATSGVLLVCTQRALAESIRREFRERRVYKSYVALVFGKPSVKSALWRDHLRVDKRGGQIRTQARAAGHHSAALGTLSAECQMALLHSSALRLTGDAASAASARSMPSRSSAARATASWLSLLKLEPRTGRSHQLRVQCARRGLPIVGDATYGDFAANRAFSKSHGSKRLFLHSQETRFDYHWRGQRYHFAAQAPLPEAFASAAPRAPASSAVRA